MLFKIIKYLFKILRLIKNKFFYIFYSKQFKYYGINSQIISPLYIQGRKNIYIGNKVTVGYKAWLAAMPLTGNKNVELIIKGPNRIAPFSHIYSTGRIVIEESVNIAPRCYISDNLHGYEDINIPIMDQPIKQLNGVIIGKGSWVGENVCIIGASIGKHCVIGANAVVTKDIPDYSVAVGIPARVIKRFNFETQMWERTNPDGSFLE